MIWTREGADKKITPNSFLSGVILRIDNLISILTISRTGYSLTLDTGGNDMLRN